MKTKVIGQKHFGPVVDITDPCYDNDVWCRLNNIKIKEGDYDCVTWLKQESYKDNEGKTHRYYRVARLGIYLNGIPSEDELSKIGEIGVDAGLAGVFNSPKPNYDNDEWSAFCDTIRNKDYLINNEGFFSSSGWGDGMYPVYAQKDEAGEIIAIEIAYM